MSYRAQIVVLVLWIFAVTAIFRLVEDRQVASLIAGAGFIVFPAIFLLGEIRNGRRKIHMTVLVFFLVLCALPIFLLRIANWGTDFSQLSLLSLPAPVFHKVSNIFYILVLVSAIYHHRKAMKDSDK